MKLKFQVSDPHPVIQVAKLECKNTTAPFIVTYINFNRDPTLPDLTYGKIIFTIDTQALNTLHPFILPIFTSYTQILFYTLLYNIFIHSHALPIELTDTDNYLPADDPNFTNYMLSHYDCEKQHYLRQFNLLNV